MEIRENIVKIQGKVIKVDPAYKTGYYLIIQEQGTSKQKGAFSQWSYELESNYLFTLRQDNKYWFITNYQVLNEPKPIKSTEESKIEPINQSQFYRQHEAQEIQRLKQLIQKLEIRIKKAQQEKQELKNLILNRNYIYYQLFNLSAQAIKSKKGKPSQYYKKHLENCELVLDQLKQERKELKSKLNYF